MKRVAPQRAWAIVLVVASGCNGTNAGPSPQPSLTDESVALSITLGEDNASQKNDEHATPTVSSRDRIRVAGTIRLGPNEKPFNPIIRIVRSEEGIVVTHNSATTKRDGDGETYAYSGVIRAPTKNGAFTIEAVMGPKVLESSPLNVK